MTPDAAVEARPPTFSLFHVPRTFSLASLIAIIALAATLRFWRLEGIPPGINQDEAVHAYDAWSLLRTGRDHDGAAWPIFFRAFGDYHPGPYIYAIIPFEALLGLRVLAARLPAALIGTAAIPLAYLLMRRRYGELVALFAAALIAISPWHVHLSRLAFEAGTCPTLLLLAFVLLLTATRVQPGTPMNPARARSLVLFTLGGLVLGLTAWTYHAMRVVVPVLLFGMVLISRRTLSEMLRTPGARIVLITAAGGLLIGLTPFLAATALAPQQVWARATAVTGAPDGSPLLSFAHGYLAHFSPEFLLFHGDRSEIQSLPGYGQLHLPALILLPLGVWRLIANRRTDRFGLLLVFWVFIGPLPAALTTLTGGHALRSVGMLPAVDLVSAVGAVYLISLAGEKSAGLRRLTFSGLIVALTVCTVTFSWRFFVRYPVQSAPAFQAEWKAAFDEVEARRNDYDLVLLSTDRTNQLGMLYLFWTQMDPASYQECDKEIEELIGIERIVRIENILFRQSAFLPFLRSQFQPDDLALV